MAAVEEVVVANLASAYCIPRTRVSISRVLTHLLETELRVAWVLWDQHVRRCVYAPGLGLYSVGE